MTNREMILRNVITDILREVDASPDDSIQDIANEKLKEWETGLKCNSDFVIGEAVTEDVEDEDVED